jgi:oligosaccharide translocation protein RFT1
VHAASSSKQLKVYNMILVAFSAVYMLASWYFIQVWHTTGLVLANCVNMLLRIAFNLHFMKGFFAQHPGATNGSGSFWQLQSIVPPVPVLVMLCVSYLTTRTSEMYFAINDSTVLERVLHVAIGSVCFAAVLLVIYATDRKLLIDVRQLFRTRQIASKQD